MCEFNLEPLQIRDVARIDRVARRHKKYFENIEYSIPKTNSVRQNICKQIRRYIHDVNEIVTCSLDSMSELVVCDFFGADEYIKRLISNMNDAQAFICTAYTRDLVDYEVSPIPEDYFEEFFEFNYTEARKKTFIDLDELNTILNEADLPQLEEI